MTSLTPDVSILCWNAPTNLDRNAQKITAFLGVEATLVSLNPSDLVDRVSIRKTVGGSACLIVSADVLAQASDAMPAGSVEIRDLINSSEHVFVYGFRSDDRHHAILQALSDRSLIGVRADADLGVQFRVAEGCREWCGSFSGVSLGAVDPQRESAFLQGADDARHQVIIRTGDKPFFVRMRNDKSQLFFLACGELADLDEPVSRHVLPSLWFSRLVPLMMFLRGALGDRVWHNDNPRACFIIDDPLLKPKYGFLQHKQLLEVVSRKGFSACISFIPWNYRRSSREVAKMVSSNYPLPFLCVHGCDHTGAEFATMDYASLRWKAQLALERMRTHTQLSGLPFDDVMVFPQGHFSAEAVTALKNSGYLATINGEVCPSTMPQSLILRDLLDVAVTKFADFPLFVRRYPHNVADLAFDLFMGKPAVVVEHHGFFRNGYGALETLVQQLNSLESRLEWTNPGAICSHSCLTRASESGDIHVRFYTGRFRLRNRGVQAQKYVLVRRQTRNVPTPSVTIDGKQWSFEQYDGDLKIALTLGPGQVADVRVLSEDLDSVAVSPRSTAVHNSGVWIRRFLSEFRDNYVDTTQVYSRALSALRSLRTTTRGNGPSGKTASRSVNARI